MQHTRQKLTWTGGRTWNINVACFLVVLCFKISLCQDTCSSGPCYPAPLDIAGQFNVTANSTCGDPEERFCVNLNCSNLCKANSPGLEHPSSFVTDNKDATFWKSVNFEYPVVLQLDIGRTFMLYQSRVTFYHELPAAMYLLKSNDSGRTYSPISYFATDCLRFFNLSETPENEVEGLKVQCFKIDRAANPSKQLYYSPMQDVKTAENLLTDTQKQAFFLMTNLRMVLVKFITPSDFDPATLTEFLQRSYFFSVSDWDVLASCHCNGQASKCDPNDHSKCVCERNTEGVNCERCLRLFNNKPYQIREPCEDCGCNNHSESCSYNNTKGYGVCDDCLHNTMGDKCNQCKPSYFRNPDVLFSHASACLACACHGPGVNSSADSSQCNNETGQCACKSQVTGRVCDTCHDEFWNLTIVNDQGCEGCGCNTTGTVNASNVCNKETGQCACKPLLTGRTCNKCQDGYYGLTAQNPGCSFCNCNPAGSVNQTCSSTGHCFCRPRFFGDKCENIEQGFFVPNVDYVTYEAEDATLLPAQEMRINHTNVTNTDGASILVVGVVLTEGESGASPTKLSFIINLPKTAFFSFILRYMTSYQWKLIKITVLLRSPTFTPFSCKDSPQVTRNEPHILIANVSSSREALNFGSRCLMGGQYTVDLEIPFGSAVPAVVSQRRRRALLEEHIVVDSIVVMPTLTETIAFQEASPLTQENMTFFYNQSFSLRTWKANLEEVSAALSPVFGELFGEGQACNCSIVGSDNPQECEQNGGQCKCKSQVIGRKCEQCSLDYFNFTSGQGCQACDCHVTGSKQTSCHPDTGQCSCKNNVTGLHCDSCQRYYYNFHSGVGCSPCNCHPTYSSDLQCDGSTGKCSCKPGINDGKCTACQSQFYNLSDTGCLSCHCDPAGSLTLACNKTTGQCPCKAQALGRVCAECPVGYYGLSTHHPDGCLRCQCSNKSSTCVSDTGWFISKITTTLSTQVDNVDKDGWSAVNGGGQTVESLLDWDKWAVPLEKGSIKVDTSTFEEIYFNAPAKYLGDQRFAYTYSLSFKLQQDNASSPTNSSSGDVILTGRWFNQPLVTALNSPPPGGDHFKEYTVKLFESYWRVGTTSGRQPTSSELILVLSDLTSLHIRAKWTSLHSQLYSRIGDISLTISNRTSVLPQLENASNVEDCSCPDEYEGQFCEQCAIGFTRVIPNGGPYVACLTCMCNGHSNTCDPETGVCHNCQHNTAGDHCEKCADGWYGNATNGTSQDCNPCPCPGGPSAPNQFATTCKLDSDGLPTCVNCSEGHKGRYCEFCMDGYFGQPMEQNGECLLCSCNDNIDLGASGNCNSTSGECLKCLYNTSGFNCEWCATGFYGNAMNKTCKGCTCSNVGATSNVCHNISGTCDCQPHVTGMFCDKCEQNAYNFTRSGCTLCNCDVDGSTDLQCDLMLGNCSCHPNVIGTKCNMCSKGFFDVTQRCQDCDCTANQTVANTTCNAVTGQCECSISLAGGKYGGRTCEKCAVHTVGSPPSCYPCTEQCFLNWFNIIANESAKIDLLSEEVTKMLESFGSMSVDHINHTLQDLHRNVSYAKQIFQSGGREDLEKRQNQINQIQNSISELQQQLNDSKDLIDDAQEYLADHVINFNGSVQITPATPVMYPSLPIVCPSGGGVTVIVDWKCIEAMALTYRQRAFQANESAHGNYTSIQSSYDMIELANVTAFVAARQVNESLNRLQQVSILREQVESDLGVNFQSLYLNHSMRLAETRRLVQALEELLSQTKTLGKQANASVTNAEETSLQAESLARQRKRDAKSAMDNATNAQSDALQAHNSAENAFRLATEFKENATRVLNQTQDALRNVTTGINTVGRVNNMTQESISISDEVKGMSMPVSLDEIQKLADDILNTDVSEELVNQTLETAEKSLQQAREVERLSQRAVNVSRQTLQSVEEIDETMVMAEQYRREALDLQQQTDGMIGNITNITQTSEQRFSVAYSAGQSLLTEINSTLVDFEEGLICFDTAKNEAQNASNAARKAFNISKKAKEIFENSSASLSPAAALLNSSYEEANSSLAEVEQAHQNSVQLLKDVTEAEVLLQQYINQREELEKLGQEITQLDREADELLTKFSEAAERYGECAGA